MSFKFQNFVAPPSRKPVDFPARLKSMQSALHGRAVWLLGKPNPIKIIDPCQFHESGPRIFNFPSTDRAYARLSLGSQTDWVCAFVELAHETVHLLDPISGMASNFEEAVAVRFAEQCSREAKVACASLPESYQRAVNMADALEVDVFALAKRIRADGRRQLSSVTAQELLQEVLAMNGSCDEAAAQFLSSEFPGK